MPQQKKQVSVKSQALRQNGTFNPKAREVRDRLFLEEEFFDSQDLAQVKYEMLRRVRKEGAQVSQAAANFGFSRPSFYKAQEDFVREGLAGLIGKKRGPKGRHKLSTEILDFVAQRRIQDPSHRDCAELLRLSKWTYRTLRGASPTGLIKKPVFGFALRSSGARKSRGSSVDGGSKPISRLDFAYSLERSRSAGKRA
jgi:transposase